MQRMTIFVLFLFSLASRSHVTINDAGGYLTYEGKTFVLNMSKVNKEAHERLFGDDKARKREIDALARKIPDRKVDLKKTMSNVRNQGQRGTCSNFATMALLEHLIDKNADYSEQCLTFFGSSTDSGNINTNLEYIKGNGMYHEHQCPYKIPEKDIKWHFAKDEERKEIIRRSRDVIPDMTGVTQFSPTFYIHKQDVDAMSEGQYVGFIIDQIDKGIPVGVGVYVAGNGWESGMIDYVPSEEEIKESCRPRIGISSPVKECGSHAIVLTGYDSSRRLIYFKNSWNTTWGLNESYLPIEEDGIPIGYGALSYEYLAKFRLDNLVTLSK